MSGATSPFAPLPAGRPLRVIGLMSGTSLDGVDAALVEFGGSTPADPGWRLAAFVESPYPADRRQRIHDAILDGTPAALCRLHVDLGEWFADAAREAWRAAGLDAGDVDLLASHGQTVWHVPREDGVRAASLQLGCPATMAERTGVPVVSDFRARDTAAGGEGAPLVPWVDRVLFSSERTRVLQNIGGMANLTRLPPRGSAEPLLAFDTGPGNAMIDAAVELATDGVETFDRNGERARRGTVDGTLLEELLAHPFFGREPPRSTGREVFGRPMVEELARHRRVDSAAEWDDLVATLTELTARSIAGSVRAWVLPRGADELVVTGGGARNPVLLERIAALVPELPVRPPDALGLDPGAKEAVAFATLGWAFMHALPGNDPHATGARGRRVLGSYTPGRLAEAP